MNKTIITFIALASIVLTSCNGKQPKEVSEEEFFAKASEVNDDNNYTRATVEYSASAKGSYWTGFQSEGFEKKSINGKYKTVDDEYYYGFDYRSEIWTWGTSIFEAPDGQAYVSSSDAISEYILIGQLKSRYEHYINIKQYNFFGDVDEKYLRVAVGEMLFFSDYDNSEYEEYKQKYYVDGFEIRSSYVEYTYLKGEPDDTKAVNIKNIYDTRLVWDNNGMLESIQQKITVLTGIARFQWPDLPEFPDGYNFSKKLVIKHTWKLSYK